MTRSRRIAEALARGWTEYRDSVILRRAGQTARWVSGGIEAMGTCPAHGWYRAVFSLATYPVDGQPVGCPECVALLPPPFDYRMIAPGPCQFPDTAAGWGRGRTDSPTAR